MPHSFGVSVASDWADKDVDDPVFGLYKNCGLWTMDEVQILAQCADRLPHPWSSTWVDLGAHSGWTSAHIKAGVEGRMVECVDPMLAVPEFRERLLENRPDLRDTREKAGKELQIHGMTSNEFFGAMDSKGHYPGGGYAPQGFDGACIDGDHSPGKPLEDARNALAHLAETGVIILHDFIGQPVQEAAVWLMDQGMKCRVYETVHMVAVCWRGDFTPPDYVQDPRVPDMKARCAGFPFGRCV